jgi:hypothetical protein
MRSIFGILIILSGTLLAAYASPKQKLFAGNVLDTQRAKQKLDSRIQPPDPRKYEGVRDGNDWLNPYLVFRPDGVEVISSALPAGREVVSRNELKKVLISLPVSAWPYGRVIGVQDVGIRSGSSNTEAWRKDEKLIMKNKVEANKVLASLGIKVNWWPSN